MGQTCQRAEPCCEWNLMKTSTTTTRNGICILVRSRYPKVRLHRLCSLIRSPEGNPISYVTAIAMLRLELLFKSLGSRIEIYQHNSPFFPPFVYQVMDSFKALSPRECLLKSDKLRDLFNNLFSLRRFARQTADKVYVYNSSASLALSGGIVNIWDSLRCHHECNGCLFCICMRCLSRVPFCTLCLKSEAGIMRLSSTSFDLFANVYINQRRTVSNN